MTVQDITLRLVKGSPLTNQEGDDNFRALRDALNAVLALFGVALNPDGTLKPGSINNENQFSTAILDALMFRPGDVRETASNAVSRTGWLLCDGSAVSRVTYAALFTAIGTAYGPGDGVTTFNLPDRQGRCGIGDGTGAGLTNRAMGAKGGSEEHKLTLEEMAHMHGVASDFFLDDPPIMLKRAWDTTTQTPPQTPASYTTRGNDLTGGGSIADAAAVSNGLLGTTNPLLDADADPDAHENMQPYQVFRYWIKT